MVQKRAMVRNLTLKLKIFLDLNFRFFSRYLIIGVMAVFIELILKNTLIHLFGKNEIWAIISVFLGVVIMFYLNIKFNFKIIQTEIRKTFLFFVTISYISLLAQFLFSERYLSKFFDDNINRIITSSIFFLIFYFLHKKISFKDFKKVGLAIYSNKISKISRIFNIVKNYPDYIHVDIVDDSFSKDSEKFHNRLEEISNYWPRKEKHVHIMSKYPSKYINLIYKNSDIIIFHIEIDENIKDTILKIKKLNKKVGIAIMSKTNIKKLESYINEVDLILILCIEKPGRSGQNFIDDNIKKINFFQNIQKEKKFKICVDGGLNYSNINRFHAEYIVSSSAIINSADPLKTINKLQNVF